MGFVIFAICFVIGAIMGHFGYKWYAKRSGRLRGPVVTIRPLPAGQVVNGQLVPVGATAIRTVDMVTNVEDNWCLYPIEGIDAAISALNDAYAPLKLFWRAGDIRPDVLERQREEQRRQREQARYITRPLERKGIPIYRNNTWPAEIVAYAPDRASALKLQASYALQGISTSVPGEGVY